MGRTYSGVLGVIAECKGCGWYSEARNALGNAARHARASGHNVVVEQTISVSYNDPRGDSPPTTAVPSPARTKEDA